MNTTPYIGLRPFERHETELFFGREQHSDELIARLGSHRFLAVIGNSGCGKSSLVKTGLIAGLEAGFLATPSSYWRIVEMRPGNHPFKALAEQLLSVLQPELAQHYTAASLEQRLRLGSLSLHELLAEYPPANNAQLLIVCDQFEEVFRYAEQGAALEAALFVGLLLASSTAYPLAAEHISERIYVVITMRSDFLGDCAQFAGLAEAINQGLYLTPRLNSQQLRAAIEEPAFVCKGDIEPALVSQLLDDADTNPDQLPLLQHSLMRLWNLANPTNPTPSPMGEDSQHPQLTLTHYHQLANAHESKHQTDGLNFLSLILSNHADEVYNALSPRQQPLAEHLFRLLTAQDLEKRDTRRPQTLAKLVYSCQRPYLEVITVIDVFRQPGCGFLLPPSQQVLSENQPDTIIDISHESLIRHWQRLQKWMADEAEQLKKYQRWLDEATRRQNQDGFTNLLESPELEPAEAWLSQFKPTAIWAARYTQNTAESILPEHQAADDIRLLEHYISLSRIAKDQQLAEQKHAQQQKLELARRISLGLSCVSLIAGGLTYWALVERQNAEHTEQQRTTELYQAQLTHAALLAKGEDYAGAKAILAKTYALDKTIPASKQHQRNLLASFSALKGGAAEQVYEGAGYPLQTLAVSPDGQTLAAAGEQGTLVIFEVAT
ncbi:MAG: ATP-binding protein, partial [Methylococcaceae bacterium]|nr:ATP-binding protein [Methylococcaceae bacterium]